MGLYVKVFKQILESSIAEDYQLRHIFEDLLKLADREGVIDMTPQAIARQLNIPLEIIQEKLERLEQPDPESRSENEDGRRIVLIAPHRKWGWKIVNYVFYRDLIDQEALRVANCERKREQRAREKAKKYVTDNHGQNGTSGDVTGQTVTCHATSQNVTLLDVDTDKDKEDPSLPARVHASNGNSKDPNAFVPPKRSSFIDFRNLPFNRTGVFESAEVQGAVRDFVKHRLEKWGLQYTAREFHSLLNVLERIPTSKQICQIIDKTISSGWKNLQIPDEIEYQR